jgi:hypothetical protein
MRSVFPLLIILSVALISCEGEVKPDSGIKIDPVKDPESALRSFFFTGDSVSLEVGIRPEVSADPGKYGIRVSSPDPINVEYSKNSTVTVGLDSLTPLNTKIKSLYISSTNKDSYWKCAPARGATEVKSFTFTVSNTVKSGTFPLKIWASLQGSTRDSNNVLKTFFVTVPEKTISVSLK